MIHCYIQNVVVLLEGLLDKVYHWLNSSRGGKGLIFFSNNDWSGSSNSFTQCDENWSEYGSVTVSHSSSHLWDFLYVSSVSMFLINQTFFFSASSSSENLSWTWIQGFTFPSSEYLCLRGSQGSAFSTSGVLSFSGTQTLPSSSDWGSCLFNMSSFLSFITHFLSSLLSREEDEYFRSILFSSLPSYGQCSLSRWIPTCVFLVSSSLLIFVRENLLPDTQID